MSQTNFQKFTACLIGPIQALETALQELLTQRTVDLATGETLTMLGKLVGRARNGITDDEIFRRHVRAQIATNKSDGLIEDLITIADLVVYDDAASYIVDNQGPAAVVIEIQGVALTADVSAVLMSFLRRAVAGGVRILVEMWGDPDPEELFTFDGTGPGGGFGDTGDVNTGGMLISVLE